MRELTRHFGRRQFLLAAAAFFVAAFALAFQLFEAHDSEVLKVWFKGAGTAAISKVAEPARYDFNFYQLALLAAFSALMGGVCAVLALVKRPRR